jgi:hypothetical protein
MRRCSSLQTIRTLVSPTNSHQNIAACQRTVSQCGKKRWEKQFCEFLNYFWKGLLHRLCVMLTLTTIPADVLAEVSSISLFISSFLTIFLDYQYNWRCRAWSYGKSTISWVCDEFHWWICCMNEFRPVLFNLLYTMVAGEKQSFSLRISILYCLQCYLYKNDFGKSIIVQTLLPQTENGE